LKVRLLTLNIIYSKLNGRLLTSIIIMTSPHTPHRLEEELERLRKAHADELAAAAAAAAADRRKALEEAERGGAAALAAAEKEAAARLAAAAASHTRCGGDSMGWRGVWRVWGVWRVSKWARYRVWDLGFRV
jgi:hypothetical protein